jgi:catechol-2,3-dioxygenase
VVEGAACLGTRAGVSGTDGGFVEGFCELTLQTRDPERLAEFYRAAFGFEDLSRGDDRIWLACGRRSRLGLWSPGEKEFGDQGGRHVHYAYSVSSDGIEELMERLRALDVAYRGPVEHPGGDRSLYFEDPEGNVVEAWNFFQDGDGAREGVDALKSG